MMNNNLYGNFRNRYLTQIWEDADEFLNDWKESGLYQNGLIPDANVSTLYYLLYARYGNSVIASFDEEQFAYKVFSIIFQYGPTWSKRLEIQSNLRGMTLTELQEGAKAIYNHAYNPSTAPSTDSLTELNYINEQNTNNFKRSKIDAYVRLWDLLKVDISEELIKRFQPLFLTVVSPEYPLWYVSEDEEEEGDD